MPSSNINVRNLPLRLIAGLYERIRRANALINAGDPALRGADRPVEASFETLAAKIGETAKWTIAKSGSVSALNAWGRR